MECRSKRSVQKPAPWYADGLRFACRPDCAACCTTHGEYAYVYLERGEMTRMAEYLGLSLSTFRRRYTTLDEGHRVLRMDLPECPFLDGTRCGVYPVRPAQCRSFPFWNENLRSPKRWAALRSFCPGIGEGPRQELLTIRGHLSARKAGEEP